MIRGEVWWGQLPAPVGSAPGFARPVVIASAEAFLSSRMRTAIVVPVSSRIERAGIPGHVLLGRRGTGLEVPSVALTTQVTTLDRSLLARRLGRLSKEQLAALDEGLALALGIRTGAPAR